MSACALNSAGSVQFRKESNQHALSMTNRPRATQVPDVSLFAALVNFRCASTDAPYPAVLFCARSKMMVGVPTKSILFILVLFACRFVVHPSGRLVAQAQSANSPQAPAQPHNVLSRQPLRPAMRSRKARVAFSPDGKYLLLQNDSGVSLFRTQPLKPVLHIDADYLYPVRFSGDSQSLSGVSFALRTVRWRVPNGEVLSVGELQVPDGCLGGDLSPDGESFVCHQVDLSIHVYDLNSRREMFAEEPHLRIPQSVTVPFALPPNNGFSAALGLVSVRSLQIFANEGLYPDKFAFSPDGKLFSLATPADISLWSISGKHKVSVPGAVNRYPEATLCFLDSGRVLITGVPQHSEIISLTSGKVVGKLDFEVSTATLGSNPRYLIFGAKDTSARRLYDLTEDRVLDLPDNIAIDVRDDVLAVLDAVEGLHLSHLGQQVPYASTPVPQEGVPARFSVAASPSLDLLSFGFSQETGLYRVATGERILSLGDSAQVSIPDSQSAYFLRRTADRTESDVLQAHVTDASVSSGWKTETTFVRGTPSVFFEYEPQGPKQNVPEVLPDGKIPFQLTAREPNRGDVLWKESFITSHPVPFIDSQGKNFVLAWEAGTDAARSAAKRCPQAWPLFQKAKATRSDTFFEVLDSASGQTLGGVLVRTGSGPLSFDSVASLGSTLIIARAEGRVTLYSLGDGEIKAHLNGALPAGNSRSQLLALVENETQLGIYDLRSGRKLDVQHFGQPIMYAHFSEDGQRLLVLTRPQIVYVLDVSDAARSIRRSD